MKLICYDFKTDKRQIIGRIESKYDLSDIRNTKIIHQLIYPASMPLNLKQKLTQILHRFDTKLYKSVCYYAKIYKGTKSPHSQDSNSQSGSGKSQKSPTIECEPFLNTTGDITPQIFASDSSSNSNLGISERVQM